MERERERENERGREGEKERERKVSICLIYGAIRVAAIIRLLFFGAVSVADSTE